MTCTERQDLLLDRDVLTRTVAVSLVNFFINKLHHVGFMLRFRFMWSVWVANFKVLLPPFWRCR